MSFWSAISDFFGASSAPDDNQAAAAYAFGGKFGVGMTYKQGPQNGPSLAHELMGALSFVSNTPGVKQAIAADRWAYSNVISRPISTVALATNPNSGVTSVADAWDKAKNISPGQAVMGQGAIPSIIPGFPGLIQPVEKAVWDHTPDSAKKWVDDHASFADPNFDILNPNQRNKAFHDQFIGKATSGTGDAIVNWYLDPAVLVGRVAGAARAGSKFNTNLARDRNLLSTHLDADSERVAAGGAPETGAGTTVQALVGQSAANNLQHKVVMESDNPELVASAFSHAANFDEGATLMKVFTGDAAARETLRSQSAYISDQLDRAEGVLRNPMLKENAPDEFARVQGIVDDLRKRSTAYQNVVASDKPIVDAGEGYGWAARRAEAAAANRASLKYGKTSLWSDEVYQDSPWAHPIRMIKYLGNERPSGILGLGETSFVKSANEATAYVGLVKAWDAPTRRLWVNKWANTTGVTERQGVADAMQRQALADTARSVRPEWSDEEAVHAANEFMAKWKQASSDVYDQASSSGGNLFAAGDDGALVVDPELMSQLGSTVSTAPIDQFAKMVADRNWKSGAVNFKDWTVHKIDQAYQLWRPAVLWHMGFTVKQSVMEPNLRAMAYLNQKAWTDPLLLGRPSETILGRFATNTAHRVGDRSPWKVAARTSLSHSLEETQARIADTGRQLSAAKDDLKWFDDHAIAPPELAPGPPAFPGGSSLYHGSSHTLNNATLESNSYANVGDRAGNLVGPGFYTTDSVDIAGKYTGKGSGKSPTVHQVTWRGDSPPKMMDLDQPVSEDFLSAVGEILDDYIDPGDLRGLDGVTAYGKIQEELSYNGVTGAHADELLEDLSWNLDRRGYDGFTHVGGGRVVAGSQAHNVSVFFDTSKVRVRPHAAQAPAYERPDDAWFTQAHEAARKEVAVHEDTLSKLRDAGAGKRDALSVLAKGERKRVYAGQKGKRIGTVDVPGPAEGSYGETMRALSGAESTIENSLMGPEALRLHAQKLGTGYEVVEPTEKHYFSELADRLNKQLRSQDPVRMIASGASQEDVVRFLRTTRGKQYMRNLGFNPADADSFALQLSNRVDSYTHGDQVLLSRLADNQPISEGLVKARLKGRTDLNPIHGHPLEFDREWLGRTDSSLKNFRNRMYHYIAALPENRMSRHPFYDHVYWDYVQEGLPRRAADVGGWEHLGQDAVDDVVRAAHRRALSETMKTIYTISRYSNAAAALRWASPFFQASLNQWQTWGRLFYRNPAALAHYAQVMGVPVKMHALYDRDGNPTNDPWNPESHFALQVPKAIAEKVPYFGKLLENESGVQISPHAIDPILQGEPWYSPGAGPIVGIVASEVVKKQPKLDEVSQELFGKNAPDMEAFFKNTGILPYGASNQTGSWDMAVPSDLKNIYNLWRGQDSQTYANSLMAIYQTQLLDWKLNGSKGPPPDIKQAEGLNNKFFILRFGEALLGPVAMQHESKYAPAINDYHNMLAEDPKNAMKNFLDKWGLDYAYAMMTLSKNPSGVAPNRATVDQLYKYRDLIDKNSDVDLSMVGAMFNQTGDYSSMAYGWELANGPQSDSTEGYRGKSSASEAKASIDTQIGWQGYISFTNQLDAIKAARGIAPTAPLPDDLQLLKNTWVQAHTTDPSTGKYTDWYKDYSSRDDLTTASRVLFIQKTLDDPKWSAEHGSDPQWIAAAKYLQARQAMVAVLAARKASGGSDALSTQSNADLAAVWTAQTSQLAESNTDWGDFYTRYLENDALVPLPSGGN